MSIDSCDFIREARVNLELAERLYMQARFSEELSQLELAAEKVQCAIDKAKREIEYKGHVEDMFRAGLPLR